jgi:hypothetical protein
MDQRSARAEIIGHGQFSARPVFNIQISGPARVQFLAGRSFNYELNLPYRWWCVNEVKANVKRIISYRSMLQSVIKLVQGTISFDLDDL